MNLDKNAFRDRFGENPRKDDLTILYPRQDDPTEQVMNQMQQNMIILNDSSLLVVRI
jgi:hypothetical protein